MLSERGGAFGALFGGGAGDGAFAACGVGEFIGEMRAMLLGYHTPQGNSEGIEDGGRCDVPDAGIGGVDSRRGGEGAGLFGKAFGPGNLALDANAACEGGRAKGGKAGDGVL